ncbi:hypothetical protein SY86_00670 [Erwinia tracheiphila]|uniref:Uncharacterized protein n=1 Tax=Erwinia tracheiphila TaxID=65700 RepID=A0A0M2KGJ4_9GAMM|nr:hypothetical protein ETR_15901 [Erwinia tracheiphila PSU-1]KKF38079.1 hypothetical protein SY86_00670 [Erwinia tracheiphila]
MTTYLLFFIDKMKAMDRNMSVKLRRPESHQLAFDVMQIALLLCIRYLADITCFNCCWLWTSD